MAQRKAKRTEQAAERKTGNAVPVPVEPSDLMTTSQVAEVIDEFNQAVEGLSHLASFITDYSSRVSTLLPRE